MDMATHGVGNGVVGVISIPAFCSNAMNYHNSHIAAPDALFSPAENLLLHPDGFAHHRSRTGFPRVRKFGWLGDFRHAQHVAIKTAGCIFFPLGHSKLNMASASEWCSGICETDPNSLRNQRKRITVMCVHPEVRGLTVLSLASRLLESKYCPLHPWIPHSSVISRSSPISIMASPRWPTACWS